MQNQCVGGDTHQHPTCTTKNVEVSNTEGKYLKHSSTQRNESTENSASLVSM
jgi:hypothetical protein